MNGITPVPHACRLCGATPKRTDFGIYHPWSEQGRCSMETKTLREDEWNALMGSTPNEVNIRSAERLPTKEDANKWGTVTAWCQVNQDWLPVLWKNVVAYPENFVFWKPSPPRPTELIVEPAVEELA